MMESSAVTATISEHAKILPVISSVKAEHVFEIPTKLIKTTADMKIWEKSEAYYEYLGFILAINEAIKGKSNSRGSEKLSEGVIRLGEMLDKLDTKVDETPPVQQPQRFGNVAFRTWYTKIQNDALVLIEEFLPKEYCKAIPEISSYLIDSFGNSTRIDYGTGHELSFIMFLCCLFKIGFLKYPDEASIGCYIFPKYLDLARKLQKTYRMEPAGSHGVWSLDDYQFVPFIWGSSQLFAHPVIEPSMFLNQQVLNDYGEDYMFLTCIKYINEVKSGPFAEHSNQLWSISGVSSWTKINGGLIKMYKAEVLSKFPVVQHIVFGSLFTLKPIEQCTKRLAPKPSITAAYVSPISRDSSISNASISQKSSSPSTQSPSARSFPQEERTSPDGSADEPGSLSSKSIGSPSSNKTSSSLSSKAELQNEESKESSNYEKSSRISDTESGVESVRFADSKEKKKRPAFLVGGRGPTVN